MCNRFTISATPQDLASFYQAILSPEFEQKGGVPLSEVFPYSPAPGLLLNTQGNREVRPMQFSITPAWSKEQKVKYQTNNARVEDIETKKTFSGPLKKHRCLIPISRFREASYWGASAGKELEFEPVGEELLYAAGIYSIWQRRTTMALVMRPAGEYIMQHGHHRQPLFLSEAGVDAWITGGEREASLSKQVLQQYAYEPELRYTVAREMAPAWKSRQKAHLTKRDEQLEAIASGGPLGY